MVSDKKDQEANEEVLEIYQEPVNEEANLHEAEPIQDEQIETVSPGLASPKTSEIEGVVQPEEAEPIVDAAEPEEPFPFEMEDSQPADSTQK